MPAYQQNPGFGQSHICGILPLVASRLAMQKLLKSLAQSSFGHEATFRGNTRSA